MATADFRGAFRLDGVIGLRHARQGSHWVPNWPFGEASVGNNSCKYLILLVGAAGFEPATCSTQNCRATRLRYTPPGAATDTSFASRQQGEATALDRALGRIAGRFSGVRRRTRR